MNSNEVLKMLIAESIRHSSLSMKQKLSVNEHVPDSFVDAENDSIQNTKTKNAQPVWKRIEQRRRIWPKGRERHFRKPKKKPETNDVLTVSNTGLLKSLSVKREFLLFAAFPAEINLIVWI